ncbi:MFS transporter [Paraburkholderia dipogonis]|uniref:MFS transporter n=1 Tax=Paraburkholderia dipogonis TaxID=1211383 RepID=UPI0038B84E9B
MNGNSLHETSTGQLRRTRGRWLVIAPLLILFSFTVQMDKTNMSVVIADHTFLRALDLVGKPAHIGMLNTLFVAGYGIGMLLWGFVIDWIGPRRSAMLSICGWAFFTFICGRTTSVTELYVARALLGAAEGCIWPLANSYTGRWFPSRERSRVTGMWVSGAFAAIAVGIPIITMILLALGWRGVFISLGIFSFVLVPLFYFFGADYPAKARFVNEAEVAYIRSGAPPSVSTASGAQPTLAQSLLNLPIVLLILVHASSSAILWGLTTWLPTYLVRERGLSMKSMSGVISISYIAPILTVVLVGYLADKARHRAWVGAAVALATMAGLSIAMSVPWLLVTAFLLVLGIAAPMIFGGLHSAMLHDYVPHTQIARSTGIVVGLGNLLGSFSPAAMGYLVGVFGGKFLAAWVMIIGLNGLSLIMYTVIALMKRPRFVGARAEEPTMVSARSRP